MNIGIIGSSNYSNYRMIKDILFDLKTKDKELIIAVRGNGNFDSYIKKICNEFIIKYKEVPRFDDDWNAHCIETLKPFYFNRPYNIKYAFIQIASLVKYSNIIIVFVAYNNELQTKQHSALIAAAKSKKKEIIYVGN